MNFGRNILHYLKIAGFVLVVVMIRVSFRDAAAPGTWPNGQPRSSGQFHNGKAHGTWTWWYANGNRMTEGTFSEGKRNGTWTTWYENGTKKSETLYRDDELNGTYTTWYASGIPRQIGFYKADKPDGIQLSYDSTGRLAKRELFSEGIAVQQPAYPERPK